MVSNSIVFCCMLILLVVYVRESQGLQAGDNGVCIVKSSSISRRRVYYSVSGWCYGIRCKRRKTKFVTAQKYTNNTVCCQGWQHDSELDVCKPICSTGCGRGVCIGPGVCYCEPPLYLDPELKNNCLAPVCDNPCVNSICIQNNTCECINNTRRYNETHCAACDLNYKINSDLTCSPECHTPCINGICIAPDQCKCLDGYEYKDESGCKPHCDGCVNSECVSPNNCSCLLGYVPVNNTHCVPFCDGCEDGECVAPGNCVCREGYNLVEEGCEPICSAPCVNGECSAPEECTCYEGYQRSANISEAHRKVCCRPECGTDCDDNGECPSVGCVPR